MKLFQQSCYNRTRTVKHIFFSYFSILDIPSLTSFFTLWLARVKAAILKKEETVNSLRKQLEVRVPTRVLHSSFLRKCADY